MGDAVRRGARRRLERLYDVNPPDDAHALREALLFLEHVPDRDRAAALGDRAAEALATARWLRLAFAPAPSSRWRALFTGDEIEAHLDRLERDQQEDGGRPLTWSRPVTQAARVLTAYGRSAA